MEGITAFRTALDPESQSLADDLGVPVTPPAAATLGDDDPLINLLQLKGLTDLADTGQKIDIVEAYLHRTLKENGREINPDNIRSLLAQINREIEFDREGTTLSRLNRLMAYVKTMVRQQKENAKIAKEFGVSPKKPSLLEATREELGRILFE